MASLLLLEHKLRKAVVAGDQVAIKRCQAAIAAERKKRGKAKRKKL